MKTWYLSIEGEGESELLRVLAEQFLDRLADGHLHITRADVHYADVHTFIGKTESNEIVFEVDPVTGNAVQVKTVQSTIYDAHVRPAEDVSDTGREFGGR